jgi:hypothetical protein
MAVGFPAKTNFATGDVLTATNVNDITGTLNLVNSAQTAAGKNSVINGALEVWQRGTSIAFSSSVGYSADRWFIYSVPASTVSRQTTSDTTNLPNIQYAIRTQRNSGSTSTGQIILSHSLETSNSIPLAGKTVTLSYYARVGSNYSNASSYLAVALNSGTGTNQKVADGYTGSTTVISNGVTPMTATWTRYSFTGTVPTNSTELGFAFTMNPSGTAGVNDYFEITGVQLEAQATASAFTTASGNEIGGELALCQRYYYRTTPGIVGAQFGAAASVSTTVANAIGRFPVTMRTRPTALEQSGTANQYAVTFSTVVTACSAVPVFGGSTTENDYQVNFTVASGLTAGQAGRGISDTTNGATAYLGWSAEL